MSGSASRTSEFIAWHFGWNAGETNVIWFWLKNTGIFIPLLHFGIYLILSPQRNTERKGEREKGRKGEDGYYNFESHLRFRIAAEIDDGVVALLGGCQSTGPF